MHGVSSVRATATASWAILIALAATARGQDPNPPPACGGTVGINVDVSYRELGFVTNLFVTADDVVLAGGGLPGQEVVRRSVDGGATWETATPVPDDAHVPGRLRRFGADGSGTLYWAGIWLGDSDQCGADAPWVVKRSRDGGMTWRTVDLALDLCEGFHVESSLVVAALTRHGAPGEVWLTGSSGDLSRHRA